MFGLLDNCVKTAKYTPLAINILLHVMILFAILSCLFYFLISKVEIASLNSELKNNINNLVSKLVTDPTVVNYVNGPAQSSIAQQLKQVYSTTDPVVTTNNTWLFRSIVIANVAIFSIVLTIILLLIFNCRECVPIKDILLENIGTFILVGGIEALFFLKVAIKYIPIKPELVTDTFIQELAAKLG